MRLAGVVCALVLGACFSKPTFTQRDGGPGGDDGGGGEGFDAEDAPIDAPVTSVQLALAKLAAGGRHVCAIGNDTRLWCWGDNDHGQLGNSSDTATGSPVLASTTLGMGWTDIAAGIDHTCGIFGGTLYCWGVNDVGQSKPSTPGNGDAFMQAVTLPATPVKVFAGRNTSCAILTTNEAYCWGALDLGQSSPMTPSMPTKLTVGIGLFSAIALSDDHGCAIATDERLYCWGDDAHNELGHDGATENDRTFAMAVETDASSRLNERFKSVDVARDVTCAVTSTGNDVHCWGASAQGHLLGGPNHDLFYEVDSTLVWDSVAIDDQHACARTMTGNVYCWGRDPDGAQGKGDFASQTQNIGAMINVDGVMAGHTQVVAGEHFTCVINPNANAYCWGSNRSGELGNREIATKNAPSRVRLPQLAATDVVREIVAGYDFSCALVGDPTGAVTPYCWGRNSERQVVPGSPSLAEPVPKVALSATFTQIAAGELHACGLVQGGMRITCWGDNTSQQLGGPAGGTGSQLLMPSGGGPWTHVAAGSRASCGIADGKLSCWGDVPGVANQQPIPHDYGLAGTASWQSVSMGSGFVVGIAMAVGETFPRLMAFGAECDAGISAGGTTIPSMPANLRKGGLVSSSDQYAALVVAASQHSGDHTCIHYTTQQDGTARVTCFGQNGQQQVAQGASSCGPEGNQTMQTWRTPVAGTQSIATANAHSCALGADNQLYCWGGESNHELGNQGNVSNPGFPSRVNTGPWSGVATGQSHTCVVDGPHKAVYCWGENRHGQLGDGTRFQPAPVASGLVLP